MKEVTMSYEKQGRDFHLHFAMKLSSRLGVSASATMFNKMERHLRSLLEEYVIDKLMQDKDVLEWVHRDSKLGLLPLISKFGF
jgi:hypothetical protein